jgi:uncharacterized protein
MTTQEKHQAKSSNRGFAVMDQEKQRAIASKGSVTAHKNATAHEFTHNEAVAAGRKGGQARSKAVTVASRSAHDEDDRILQTQAYDRKNGLTDETDEDRNLKSSHFRVVRTTMD